MNHELPPWRSRRQESRCLSMLARLAKGPVTSEIPQPPKETVMRLSVVAASFVALSIAHGQSSIPVATEFEHLHFRSIGPAVMSGRIADVAVYEPKPTTYYVGTAHGGVWK